jgi:hypothetical protein
LSVPLLTVPHQKHLIMVACSFLDGYGFEPPQYLAFRPADPRTLLQWVKAGTSDVELGGEASPGMITCKNRASNGNRV